MREITSIDPAAEPSLDAVSLAALAKIRNFSTEAVRVLLRTRELILLGKGLALGHWRESRDPLAHAFAEHCQSKMKCTELRETLEIIRGRILRMPPAHRKRYSPEERFRIVVFARTYALSHEERPGSLWSIHRRSHVGIAKPHASRTGTPSAHCSKRRRLSAHSTT